MRPPQPFTPSRLARPLRHVLAATDFSQPARHAVERAAALAHEHQAMLTLLHVATEPVPWPWRPPPLPQDLRLSQARVLLARLAREMNARFGIEIHPRVSTGTVNDAIVHACERADLLVVGARPWAPWLGLWGQPFGAARARRLLTSVQRPMLVVRQPVRQPYRKALVPVDLSEHSGLALRAAAGVAPGARLHVFHALSVRHESEMRYASVADGVIRGYRERHRTQALQRMECLIAQRQLDRQRVVPAFGHGEARHLTLRKAGLVGADLIVMGKHEPSWWVDLLFGSLTRQMLREATCDVLVVPPVQASHPARPMRPRPSTSG